MQTKKKILVLLLFSFVSVKMLHAQVNCGMPDVLFFGSYPSDTSAIVFWSPISGADSYNVRYRVRNSGVDYSIPVTSVDTSLTIQTLLPSTNYEFIVQSSCGTDTSGYSLSGWFTTFSIQLAPVITRGPFMTVSTQSSVTIQWSTSSMCDTRVGFGASPASLADAVSSNALTKTHSVTLTNLNPDTKYYYSVGTISTILQSGPDNHFFTAPADNSLNPVRLWVTGDFGTGYSAQREVRDAFANYTSGQRVDGWLWLGDNAYANGTEQEYQEKVFDIYPSQLKKIPLFPSLGNHDYAQCGYQSSAARGTNFPYFSIFTLPTFSGTEKYYSTNYGNVHLIALDSYGSYNNSNSDMYNWLQADLAANTQQWTIVYFHHPPYSKGSHDSDHSTELVDMRNNIIPLLESYGVDLVLSGHSHAYERSHLIKNHYGLSSTFNSSHIVSHGSGPFVKSSRTDEGTVYVVCGVSGKVSASVAGFPHNAMYYSTVSKYGSLVIDVDGNNLSCKFLTSNGTIDDNFSMTKPPISVTNNIDLNSTDNFANIQVYPNPANDELNIRFNSESIKNFKVNISNILGQNVYEKSVDLIDNNSNIKIQRSELKANSAGFYHITFSAEGRSFSKPLILD